LSTYQLCRSYDFLKRHWNGECVVFNHNARETHLLNTHSALFLTILEQGPVEFGQLRIALEDFSGGIHEGSQLMTSDIVNALIEIGLVETYGAAS